MKKNDVLSLLRLLLAPVLVILLGLLLLCNPDSASALIAKVLGWMILLIGIGFGISAVFGSKGRVGKIIAAAVLCAGGLYLSRNPLALAAWVGRLVGILLLIDGIQDIFNARARGKGVILPVLVAAIGVVLIVMPMTTSRLVFALCGLVVTVIGIAMLLDRLRTRRLPGGDSDIIDAL